MQVFSFSPDHPVYPSLPKGAAVIASERGFNIERKKKDEVLTMLASCEDFIHEKCLAEKICNRSGIQCMFIPKYHCEYNCCELVWANSKKYCREKCIGRLPCLENLIRTSFTLIMPHVYRAIYQHALEEIQATIENGSSKSVHKKYKSHRPPVGQLPWAHLVLNLAIQ